MFVHVQLCACHGMRGQRTDFEASFLLPPCGFEGSNLDRQSWQQKLYQSVDLNSLVLRVYAKYANTI